jgi:hypothetical protein
VGIGSATERIGCPEVLEAYVDASKLNRVLAHPVAAGEEMEAKAAA